jgi:hypothetical protein
MKPNPWILPVLATLVTGVWIGFQKRSSARLEREITIISERIRLDRASTDEVGESHMSHGKTLSVKDGKIDWKGMSAKMQGMNHGAMPDMRAMMNLQKMLLDLSAEELCAHLDEIAGLDLEPDAQRELETMLVDILAKKDPQMALMRFGDRLGEEGSGLDWHLGSALHQWGEKDPTAAAAWLDRQIAAGKYESKSLDGKNMMLDRLEGSLLGALLKESPAAATARVEAMSGERREELFQHGFAFQIGKKNGAAYAQLVRDIMPSEKVGGILAKAATLFSMSEGFTRVDEFITTSKATDEERKPIVEEVMKQKISRIDPSMVTSDQIDEIRKWGTGQSPAAVDKATGKGLADSLWRGGDFENASSLVLKYHESASGDDVLSAFLQNGSVLQGHADEAKAMIDRIRDPALREEIRNLIQYSK